MDNFFCIDDCDRVVKMTSNNYSWSNYKTLGLGNKFERKKVRIAEKVELFSGRTFFLQIVLGLYGTRDATTMADHSF